MGLVPIFSNVSWLASTMTNWEFSQNEGFSTFRDVSAPPGTLIDWICSDSPGDDDSSSSHDSSEDCCSRT
jgi:hypothetical protein